MEELLDEEVTALAGERYARKTASVGGRRHGRNPGTVGLAGPRVPFRVSRIWSVAGSEIPLRSYAALHGDGEVNDLLLQRVLSGISCRNYAAAAAVIPGAIGLSGSTVFRGFIEASAVKLRELQERDLSGTEDRHDDVEGGSCVNNQGPWRVSTKNGLDSVRPFRTGTVLR